MIKNNRVLRRNYALFANTFEFLAYTNSNNFFSVSAAIFKSEIKSDIAQYVRTWSQFQVIFRDKVFKIHSCMLKQLRNQIMSVWISCTQGLPTPKRMINYEAITVRHF